MKAALNILQFKIRLSDGSGLDGKHPCSNEKWNAIFSLLIGRTTAAQDVVMERRRQSMEEAWSHAGDDSLVCEELAAFAALYAMPPATRDWPATETGYGATLGEAMLPGSFAPKFGDRRRELVKAGALILAEIERLDRAAAKAAK